MYRPYLIVYKIDYSILRTLSSSLMFIKYGPCQSLKQWTLNIFYFENSGLELK